MLRCFLNVAVLAACMLIPASAIAQVPVRVDLLDQESQFGRILGITEQNLRIRSRDDSEHSFDLATVTAVKVTDLREEKSPPVSATPWVFLETGDRLRMEPLMIDDVSVVARWSRFPQLPPVEIPLESCRGIAFELSTDPVRQGREISGILERATNADQISLRNGDRIEGEFLGLKDGNVSLETSIGATQTESEQLRSIAFNPELISAPGREGRFALLVLRDGSLMVVKSVHSDGELLLGRSVAGYAITIPVTVLRECRFFDENKVPLAELKVQTEQVLPWLSVTRSPVINRNVLGSLLRLNYRHAATGIGVTSGTSLTWQLDARYRRLRLSAGLDEAAGRLACVVFDVLADGVSVWKSAEIKYGNRTIRVPEIKVTGVQRLELRVHFSDRGNVHDIADWINPTLIR